MPKPEVTPIISLLVVDLYNLDAQIEALKAQYLAKVAELIKEGDGTYVEPAPGKRTAIVVSPAAPKPTYTLYPDAAKKVFLAAKNVKKGTPELAKEFGENQEEEARKLAGPHFAALFDRHVIFTPAKGYADLVPRLFKTATATAKKLLLLCQVTKAAGNPYVKLADKPKKTDAGEDEEA